MLLDDADDFLQHMVALCPCNSAELLDFQYILVTRMRLVLSYTQVC